MPGRDIQLVNGEIYHVLNRGVNSQKIFNCERDYYQFLDRTKYYQNNNLSEGYAQLIDLPSSIKSGIFSQLLSKKDFLVDIFAYCLMNNHFHFLIKQNIENGISKFISNLTNGYTRYYNIRHKGIADIKFIMEQFNDPASYRDFVFDHADSQRSLQLIKKLILES